MKGALHGYLLTMQTRKAWTQHTILSVVFGDLDRKELLPADIGSQPGERLPPRPTDADQHQVASLQAQHSVNSRHMANGVLCEHKRGLRGSRRLTEEKRRVDCRFCSRIFAINIPEPLDFLMIHTTPCDWPPMVPSSSRAPNSGLEPVNPPRQQLP